MGHESELYALTIDDDLRHDVRPFSDPAAAGALIAVGAPRDRAGPGEDSGRAIYGAVHQPGGTTAGR